jgi:hypothetical protein
MSAPALVTFASAIVALVVLALSATTAQSAERHNGSLLLTGIKVESLAREHPLKQRF